MGLSLSDKSGGLMASGDRNTCTTGVILVVILAAALCLNTVTAKGVNCRKFIFAPMCRGTPSKRVLLFLPSAEDNDIYRDGKPDIIDNEYPVTAMQGSENKAGTTFREMMQRQRRLYRQMDQQQKPELFDSSVYDY